MPLTRRGVLSGALGGMAAMSAARGQEQNWPTRSLRIIVPTSPGGSPDTAARLLGEHLRGRLGQSIIVESMTQGGGISGQQLVAKSTPDGYTLAMLTGGFATQAAVIKNLPYAPLKDFSFIASVVKYPMVYAVVPNSPIVSFKDLIGRARANPGKVSYAIVGAGTVYHLLGKWIDNAAGIDMAAVPYRGTAPAFTDVIGGRVDVLSDAATTAIPRIRSGQLRALAVSSPERYPLLPDVPTMAETIPGITVESWLGLAAAANTPDAIANRLNSEIRYALELPDIKKWALESGVVPAPATGDEFRKRIERDIRQWTEIVERNGITVQQ